MAEATPPLIEIRNVSKTFALQGQAIHALKDASLTITRGEFVTLIGASGCGKSTLLRIMAGFESPTSGEALMWGRPIDGPAPQRGMVFQDYALFPWLSVRQNIAFGPVSQGWPRQRVRETVDRFVEMVGLTRFADAYPHQLSGGMRQRVSIARVLANDAELVLMDEPFGALDAMTRERLQEELLDIWRATKLTVVFVTHAVEEAILLADRVVVMTPGPGRIESDNAITLARPRDVASTEFNAVRRDMSGRLHSHHGRRAA
ncbi:MAG: ABC transporter ATP-binding protein [Hyphomicrobiaceae bacterium]|nr:ABC transporter ATP-binding protein [Hyphomicrobiaceae bacterium]